MICDVVIILFGIKDVDGDGALVLGNERMLAVGLKEEAGQEETFAGGGTKVAADLHKTHEVVVVVVERKEVVEVGLNAIGQICAHGLVELLLYLIGIVFDAELAPAERLLAGHHEADCAFDGTGGIDREVGDPLHGVLQESVARSDGISIAGGGEAQAAGEGVLPVEQAEGAHLLTRIEKDLFAPDDNDGDVVVELRSGEVGRIERGATAVDDLHGVGLEAGGAGQGYIEERDFVVVAAFFLPHTFGIVDGLQLLVFAFGGGLLAGEAGVVELLEGVVDLVSLYVVGIARGNDFSGCLLQSLAGVGEAIGFLGPAFAFVLPELEI